MNYTFKNPSLLQRAITHRSYLNNGMKRYESNERLEFLGDAVLELIVCEEFFKIFPDKNEGDLTKLKSLFVNREALAKKARQMNLNQYLLLGEAEDQAGGRNRDTILSDTLEAVVGAIYIDGGLDNAKKFVKKYIIDDIKKFYNKPIPVNYKSMLLEYIQDTTQTIPKYCIIDEVGPDHNKIFTVKVMINKKSYGIGKGKSKKKAEQNAAHAAVIKIGLVNE
ncbi:MAG: ribonuclease III [bacterium]